MRTGRENPPCPRCGEAFFLYGQFREERPARPARLFGLIAAREAQPAYWRVDCQSCDYWYYAPHAARSTQRRNEE